MQSMVPIISRKCFFVVLYLKTICENKDFPSLLYRGMIFLIGLSKLANVCPTSASKTTLMCHEVNKKLKINHFMSLASLYTP